MTISEIAAILTDDPDLFLEEASGPMGSGGMSGDLSTPSSSQPMDSVAIEKQAREMGGNNKATDVMSDQLKKQQEQQKQQEQERQKLLKPQFDELNSTMSNLQNGVLQGQQAVATGNDQFGMLEKEMTSLNTILGGLQKQL